MTAGDRQAAAAAAVVAGMSMRLAVPLLVLAACGAPPAAAPAEPAPAPDAPPPPPTAALLVANKGEATLAIHALPGGERLATLPTGVGPHEIAVSPDGRRAVVTNYGHAVPGQTLTVIDLARREVTATIDLGTHRRPHGVAFLNGSGRAIVTSEVSQAVLVVDVDAGTVEHVISTGQHGTHMLALAPGGARAYVASIGSGTLSALDLAAMRAADPVAVVAASEAIAVTPDGDEVWTASLKEDVIVALDASLTERARIPAAGMPIRITATPDGRSMIVSNVKASAVQVVDVASRAAVTIPLPPRDGGETAAPIGSVVDASGRTAYVALMAEDRVAIIDLPSRAVTGHVATGAGPDGLAYVAALPAAAAAAP